MQEQLTQLLKAKNFSGVVSVYRGKEPLYLESFGFRDWPNAIPNDVSTRFGIASGTKTFTAIGIMRLIESGSIELSTPVVDILGSDAEYLYPEATVRHLLNHTSGTYDYYDEEQIEDFDNYTAAIPWFRLETPSDYLPLFASKQPKFRPGARVSYSNGGFVLLAVLIERVSGNIYRDFMHEQVFQALGMRSTGFYAFNDLPANTAWGYTPRGGALVSNIYQLPLRGGGDGGLYSNSDDMRVFWTKLFDGALLSRESLAAMTNKEVTVFGKQKYGLGLYISRFRQHRAYSAIGSDAGVGFSSLFVPDFDLNVNVFSNLTDGHRGIVALIEQELRIGT